MTAARLRFEIGRSSGKLLCVAGELDTAGAADLERAVIATLDRHPWEFCLDLTGLTSIDPTGARALYRAQRAVEPRGGQLVLTGAQRPVQRILELTGLDKLRGSGTGSHMT